MAGKGRPGPAPKKPASNPVGRPTKFKPVFLSMVTKLCLLGDTNIGVAKALGISEATFKNYMRDYPEFLASVKRGREDAAAAMANSLYHRGLGYSHPEEVVQYDARLQQWTRTKTRKHYPPDATSMIYWLKNRYPDLWNERRDEERGDPEKAVPIKVTIELKDARKAPTEEK